MYGRLSYLARAWPEISVRQSREDFRTVPDLNPSLTRWIQKNNKPAQPNPARPDPPASSHPHTFFFFAPTAAKPPPLRWREHQGLIASSRAATSLYQPTRPLKSIQNDLLTPNITLQTIALIHSLSTPRKIDRQPYLKPLITLEPQPRSEQWQHTQTINLSVGYQTDQQALTVCRLSCLEEIVVFCWWR